MDLLIITLHIVKLHRKGYQAILRTLADDEPMGYFEQI